jgi:hypothetical protein
MTSGDGSNARKLALPASRFPIDLFEVISDNHMMPQSPFSTGGCRMRTSKFASVILVVAALPVFAGESPTAPELNDQTYRKWIDFVRPSGEESKWRQVGWRTALWPAVKEARELQRPLLLWTMNGHPCGHT